MHNTVSFNDFDVGFEFQKFSHFFRVPRRVAVYRELRHTPMRERRRMVLASGTITHLFFFHTHWWFGLLVSLRSDFFHGLEHTGKCFWMTKQTFGCFWRYSLRSSGSGYRCLSPWAMCFFSSFRRSLSNFFHYASTSREMRRPLRWASPMMQTLQNVNFAWGSVKSLKVFIVWYDALALIFLFL